MPQSVMFADARAGDNLCSRRLQQTVAAPTFCRVRQHKTRRARSVAAPGESPADSKRLAVFVSGGGSNFKQIHKGCLNGSIRGEVVVRTKPLRKAAAA